MKKLFLLSLITFLFFGCSPSNNDDEPNQEISLPQLTSTSVSSITQVSAESGGTVTDDGGGIITARGVCWSTTSNPTITSEKTINGTGIGSFTSSLTGLMTNTTYYVRAYATNSKGTNYGEESSFTTLPDVIYNGDVYLTTQQEVDDFGSNGYTKVTGHVEIVDIPTQNITNLNSLEGLNSVGRDLIIRNTLLANLEGLNSLTTIGEGLSIASNNNLKNLNEINNLTEIGATISLVENDVLDDITGLSGITSIDDGGLSITGNEKLSNLRGLHNLTSITGDLRIRYTNLISLDLNGLTNIGSYVHIDNNAELITLDGLGELTYVGGDLWVNNNPVLTSLDGFSKLSFLGTDMHIGGNPNLTSFSFASLVSTEASIGFGGGDLLTNLDGFNALTSVGGGLDISLPGLTNINGLSNLSSVGGRLLIRDSKITNLNGLSNLLLVEDEIRIQDNNILNDFCGLQNIINNGVYDSFSASSNAYNPSVQDIIDGNCSQ